MNGKLSGLEPQSVIHDFEQICAIVQSIQKSTVLYCLFPGNYV